MHSWIPVLGCSENPGGEDLDKCVLPSGGCAGDLGTHASVCLRLWEKEGLMLHSGSPVGGSAVDRSQEKSCGPFSTHTDGLLTPDFVLGEVARALVKQRRRHLRLNYKKTLLRQQNYKAGERSEKGGGVRCT